MQKTVRGQVYKVEKLGPSLSGSSLWRVKHTVHHLHSGIVQANTVKEAVYTFIQETKKSY